MEKLWCLECRNLFSGAISTSEFVGPGFCTSCDGYSSECHTVVLKPVLCVVDQHDYEIHQTLLSEDFVYKIIVYACLNCGKIKSTKKRRND